MSSRALRRLQGDGDILSAVPVELVVDSDSPEEAEFQEVKSKKKNKRRKPAFNPFELLNDDVEEEPELIIVEPVKPAELNDEADVKQTKENGEKNKEKTENPVEEDEENSPKAVTKKKKKKKKKKGKENDNTAAPTGDGEDEIDAGIREVNRILGLTDQTSGGGVVVDTITSDMRALLNVEHRNLNPDNEMRRIFGSRVVQQETNRQRGRHRTFHRGTKLVQPRDNWPAIGRTGLSMSLLDNRPNCQLFTFEHNHQYQQTEFKFLEAVESLNPQNIANLLQMHPYHINGLIQLSDVFKMSEDMQMAAELIERALYAFEHTFHPSFSMTTGTCRLDFRRQENRAMYLCLFRHLLSVGQRGCNRTALEFCKLLLSLDPDGDPMCVLLMIDFYALRAEQFSFIIRMYHEWEAHRNLTQLPNFAFSVPLAMFHVANQNQESTDAADNLLQSSLIMFPGILMPLLDKCSVNPDSAVTSHPFFGPAAQNSQTVALKQLIALYIGRSFSCWKEPDAMTWLERNVKEVLARVDRKDPLVEDARQKRSIRYQGTPRNIYRHIIVSEIKDATAELPPELTTSPILSYDPLPPHDSVTTYERRVRGRRGEQGGSSLSLFLRSLLPNYNPNDPDPAPAAAPAAEGAAGGDNPEGNNLRRGIGVLMDAMRDLLNNIQPVEPPVENRQDEDGEERDEGEWD
ncbi:ribosome quality control complex subunit TCF25-like isoform X2 [Haliotis asinina]|uniref:ribosome quality control complex subunit TCF25-like isoform X2 n=1 Tax=Haliotis asinina TaxID=109174 RepID=UPI003531D4C2